MSLRIDVLGPLTITKEGALVDIGGPQPRAVLVTLVHQLGQMVTFDTLIDTLWGDDPPRSARNSLQVKVSALRNALGPTFELTTVPTGYVLESGSVETDRADFDVLCDRAAAALESDPAEAVRAAETAPSLWRGDPDMLTNADALGNPSIQVLARTILSSKTTDGTTAEARHNKAEIYRLAMASNNEKTIIRGELAMAYQHSWDNDPRRAGSFAVNMIERTLRLRTPGYIWDNLEGVASMLAILGIEPFISATLWAAIEANTTFATVYRNPRWPAAVAAQLSDEELKAAKLEGSKLSADEAAPLAFKAAENLATH